MKPEIDLVSTPYAFKSEYANNLRGHLKLAKGNEIFWVNDDQSINSRFQRNNTGLNFQFIKDGYGGGNVISIFKNDDEVNVKSFAIGNYTIYGNNKKGYQMLDVYGGAYIQKNLGIGMEQQIQVLNYQFIFQIYPQKLIVSIISFLYIIET